LRTKTLGDWYDKECKFVDVKVLEKAAKGLEVVRGMNVEYAKQSAQGAWGL
jgi:hypothetical protein